MHEPPLALPTAHWSAQKEAVRIFYKEMWDHANTALVAQLFHPDFTFRGSLGPQLVGHQQFIGYVGLGLVLSPMDGLMMSVVFGAILVLLGCGAVCDAIKSVLRRT